MKEIKTHKINEADFNKEYIETVGGLIIKEGKILLEKRPDNKPLSPGILDTPGGKVKRGETKEAALKRELKEELGIDIKSIRLYVVYDEGVSREISKAGFVRHFEYLIEEWEGDPSPKENQNLQWVDLEKARKNIFWL